MASHLVNTFRRKCLQAANVCKLAIGRIINRDFLTEIVTISWLSTSASGPGKTTASKITGQEFAESQGESMQKLSK